MLLKTVSTFVACLMLGYSSFGAELTSGDVRYWLNPEHGNLRKASNDSALFIRECFDHYRLLTVDEELVGKESEDRVVEMEQKEGRITFTCRNETLRATLVKAYWIDPDHGWLFKRIDVDPDPGIGGASLACR